MFVCLCVCVFVCVFSHQYGTAGAIRTRPGVGPPHVPGSVLGYPDPGNSGPPRVPPYCGGEGILVGGAPLPFSGVGEGEMYF